MPPQQTAATALFEFGKSQNAHKTRLFEQKIKNANFVSKLAFLFGGEGGIRTLDELLTHTRVPVVRHKPG